MIRKNVASQTVYLPQLRLTADGSAVTTGASLVVAKDGVEAAAAGTLAHYAGGIWKYTPTQGETNCAIMALVLTATGADTVLLNILTTAANPQDGAAFGIGNLDAAITSRLAPTVPGRALDVTSTGAAGIDWGNIENQAAIVSLGNTTIQLCSDVDNVGFVNNLNTGAITASSIAANALDNKGNWNIGKTGYALTAGTGLGNQTANITGNLSGSVNSVTTRVTANTDQWNGVAVTGMPMPTFTLPANFSSLFITAGGYVIVSGDAFGNTFLIPNLASQSSVNTLTTYVDTEVLAIKAKTDNLPANPAAVSDIPTVGQIADGVWDEILTGATHNIASSAGRRLRQLASVIVRAGTAQGPGTGNNQIQLDAGASSTNGDYDPGLVFIENGTGAGQARLILQYNGSTKVATVDRDWRVNPDSTSEFVILADAGRQSVNEGLAQAGSSTTITLNANASSNDDAYNGQLIFIRSGTGQDQVALVEDYVGSTKVATIRTRSATGQWAVVPDTTSAYVMIPNLTFTVAEIAAAVAEEPLAGHTTAGTLGKVLSDAGSGVSTLLSRITSNVATMFGDLIAMIQGSGVLPKWTASALSLAPTSTGSVTATVAVPQILAHTAYNTDEIIVYRGTFWSFQITNLGDLTNLDKIWFTLRKRQNDSDSKSIIQIEQTAGLLISNGATATNPSHGTLTVNGSTITITVNQQVTQYCEVTNNLNYDIKALTTGGQVRMLTISDQFIVENDVTRRIS